MNRTVLKTLSMGTLLALASTVSCSTPGDDEAAREGHQEGEAGVDDLAAPGDGDADKPGDVKRRIDPRHMEPPGDDASACDPSLTPVMGDDGPNIINNTTPDACIVALGAGDIVNDNTSTDNTILGGDGSDILNGGDGNTLVAGGAGNDTIDTEDGNDEVWGQDGMDIIHTNGGDDFADGGPGMDTIHTGDGADIAFGREGMDILNGNDGPDELYGGANDDTISGGSDADTLEGGFGDDILSGGSGGDRLVPGPGRDNLSGSSGDDTVVVFDVCELEWGEILSGGSGSDTLITPVDEATLQGMGVLVSGFEVVDVDPGLAHESECHCFHGQVVDIDDDGVTCQCDDGWGGDRCDECIDLEVCVPPETLDSAVQVLLGAAPPGVADNQGAVQRTTMFASAMLLADTTIVAGVMSITEEQRPTMSGTFMETFSNVKLNPHEVIRGAQVSTVTITFNGPADPRAENFASETPSVLSGNRRLYAVRLRPGRASLVNDASDWRVTRNDEVNLGYYSIPLSTIRTAFQSP